MEISTVVDILRTAESLRECIWRLLDDVDAFDIAETIGTGGPGDLNIDYDLDLAEKLLTELREQCSL